MSLFHSLITAAHCLLLLPLAFVLVLHPANASNNNCDFFTGKWVKDPSYPLYQDSTCPFLVNEFTCQKNGRPDLDFLRYRWQPSGCTLARFNGLDFLTRFKGKKIMFVGDSLSYNQWQSLTCMLYSSVPKSAYKLTSKANVSTFAFTEYELEIKFNRNVYLVDVVNEKMGRVLELDSVALGSKLWTGIDMFIFNTYHWFLHTGASQKWDFVKVGNQIMKDMDRMVAYEMALTTWGKWVDANVDTSKTSVYYQGISPTHQNGKLWGKPSVKDCAGENELLLGSTYPVGIPTEMNVQKKALSTIKKPVTLLDITLLSLLRKDGHPSTYGEPGKGTDCSHWCLAGVPDTWNEILYNFIIANSN